MQKKNECRDTECAVIGAGLGKIRKDLGGSPACRFHPVLLLSRDKDARDEPTAHATGNDLKV